ncbi:unnamed protein product [Cylindrotheca closterium]|uniref:Uncharacterized protein n=1 Tax=Cylindrotheca closterium TaxID=2856 RepID=A0AAD2GCZ2_9STRA|nr:unnamed protein product [Cylindrotheca closterium]
MTLDETNSPQAASCQNMLKKSLDQAMQLQQELPSMALLTDAVEELSTAASNTIASVREWSMDKETGLRSAEYRNNISNLAACCKPSTSMDDGETMVTYDTTEEEHHGKMIQRLASWNTLETSCRTGMDIDEQPPSETGAKRTVKFDYPPVQSMSEIPRVNTKDIPKLFFSEEELTQLRRDRFSTMRAEDVEVVAIPPEDSLEEEEPSIASSANSITDCTDLNDGSSSSPITRSSELDLNAAMTEPSRSTKSDLQGNKKWSNGASEENHPSYNVKILTRSIDEYGSSPR